MKTWKKLLLIFCVLGFFVCAGVLGFYFFTASREQRLFDSLSKNRPSYAQGSPGIERPDLSQVSEEERPYSPDCVGWISIEGTNVDYPVMQRSGSPEYYLRRNFYGEYSNSGTPFLDGSCDLSNPSQTRILYGHNMKNGDMFADLTGYTSSDFLEEHPFIEFETAEGIFQYEIFAALRAKTGNDEYGLLEHITIPAQEAYTQFVESLKKEALYDTGITPQWGEPLLFLVTCTNSYQEDGRMIIAARKLQEQSS